MHYTYLVASIHSSNYFYIDYAAAAAAAAAAGAVPHVAIFFFNMYFSLDMG
jgi:hypothetical protein